MIFTHAISLLLAAHLVVGFSGDSGSRSVPTRRNDRGNDRSLGLFTLWKLRPLYKTLNGYGSFGGTFGVSFGGVGGYNQLYPGSFAGGIGVGGIPGVYPGGVHPIGYPYPAIGGPGPFNIRGNKPLDRPTKSTIVEDGRLDVIDDDPVTTIKPGFVQSIVEYTSPFFHAGQRIEARNRQKRYIDY